MPSYPTARPKPSIPGPRNFAPGPAFPDTRKPAVPRPFRAPPLRPALPKPPGPPRPPGGGSPFIPKPKNPFGRRSPLRRPFRFPFPGRPSPWDYFPWGWFIPPNRPGNPFPPGSGWYIKHGPNTYPYVTKPPQFWSPAYIVPNQSGPQTGVISGQANAGYATTLDPNYWGRSDLGWNAEEDVWNASLAQIYAFVRYQEDPPLPSTDDFFRVLPQPLPAPQPDRQQRPPPWYTDPHAPDPMPAKPPRPWWPSFPEPAPLPAPEPAPAPAPPPAPARSPLPSLVLNVASATQTETQAQSGPGPAFHNIRPPKLGEREKKGKLAKLAFAFLNKVVGPITEGLDLIDAAHDALPKEYQAKSYFGGRRIKPSQKKRAEAVWKHYDKIDLDQFVKNIIASQIEDEIYGRVGQKAAQVTGSATDGIPIDKLSRATQVVMP